MKLAPVVVDSAITAFRAWSAAPSDAVKAWLAEVTDTATYPAIAASISVPRLVLVVVFHVPACSPAPISSIRSEGEYVLAMLSTFSQFCHGLLQRDNSLGQLNTSHQCGVAVSYRQSAVFTNQNSLFQQGLQRLRRNTDLRCLNVCPIIDAVFDTSKTVYKVFRQVAPVGL